MVRTYTFKLCLPIPLVYFFSAFFSHKKSWLSALSCLSYNTREQRICRIIDICGFAAPPLFSLLEKLLFYLFRGIPLVRLSVIWKADQSEDSTPLVMVIHSVMGAWTQSFRAYSTAIREVLGKGGILLLQVLLICKDWFLDLPACRFSSHGERQLENKLQGERLKKHPPNPEDILF